MPLHAYEPFDTCSTGNLYVPNAGYHRGLYQTILNWKSEIFSEHNSGFDAIKEEFIVRIN